jgi:hypothetical protein
MSPFKPEPQQRWQTYSTWAQGDSISAANRISVTADKTDSKVRFGYSFGDVHSSVKMSPDYARALAAELIAAADSIAAVEAA